MKLRTDRLLLGFHGLGLLRGWPFEDPIEAAERVATIVRLCAEADRPPMSDVIEVDALDVKNAYAAWAETYDGPNLLFDAEEPAVRGFLEGIEPGLALDSACGTGRYARVLADAGHRVVAVDASDEMLHRARVRTPTAGIARADFHRLPLRDASVDLAMCGLALTHVRDLAPPIAELARVVRPGGWVVISDVHPVAVATGAQAFFRRDDGSRGLARNYVHWPSAYVAAFRGAGLSIERAEEPRFDERFAEEMPEMAVRTAVRESLVGLPFALVWLARRDDAG